MLSFENFSFIYGDDKSKKASVSNINFTLNAGEVLILAGPSGSGKSTLSYAMNGIIPYRLKGFMKGDVKILDKSVWDLNFMDISKNVGLVKQNPLEQLVTFTVRDEIAFGLENLKVPKKEIIRRIDEIANLMGISHLLEREIDQLSGGQKQLTILCSFLVMRPKILVLDEPIAYLDQNSESLLLDRLKKLFSSSKFDLSLVIIEHRLSRVLDFADKLVVLDDKGKIALSGNVSEIMLDHFDKLKATNVRTPWTLDVFNKFSQMNHQYANLKKPSNYQEFWDLLNSINKHDLNIVEHVLIDTLIEPTAIANLESYEQKITFDHTYLESLKNRRFNETPNPSLENEKVILEIEHLTFEYPNSGIKAITDLSLDIYEGDFIGLIGPNGSGKTTLLYLLANLYEPTSGMIRFKNQDIKKVNPYEFARNIGFIFQNPENMIFKQTIRDEILYGPVNFGLLDQLSEDYIEKLIKLIGKEPADKNPFNLSWGQKRRLNLSSVFVYNPDIILLDEPFIGQDQKTIDELIETLYIENKRGKTIIVSSHDYQLLLKYTRRIVELGRNGTLLDYDTKSNYFEKNQSLGPIKLLNRIKELLAE